MSAPDAASPRMPEGPRRIAFVVSRLGLGGAERQLVSLVNSVDRKRVTPILVCLKDLGPLGADVAGDVETVALGCSNGNDPRVVGRLCDEMRSRRTELVHCTNFNATFWGRAAARRLGLPAVTAEHSTHRTTLRERALVRVGNALYDTSTASVVACAEAQVPVLVREGCSEDIITVIYNGIDPGGFGDESSRAGTRARLGAAADDVVVLVLANLSVQKNHPLLLRAAARAVGMGHPLRVVLAGDGPMRHELESLVGELGIGDRTSLLGVRRDVPDLLVACDIVALTSTPLVETFPMCLLEAMASRRAVVATRVGGVPEMVVDGETGLLVASGDEGALVSSIARLAGDPELRARLGKAGRARLETHFTLRSMTEAYESLFDQVSGRKRETR